MWRVAVLVPYPVSHALVERRRAQLSELALSGRTVFEYRTVRATPGRLVSQYDYALADVFMIEAGISAAGDGVDGICVDTVSDAGVGPLRSVLDIPVVGPGQTAFAAALVLGRTFSVVTMWPQWEPLYRRTLTTMGIQDRCVSIRSIGVEPDTVQLLSGKEGSVAAAVVDVGSECIRRDGADVIVLGSTTMHQIHAEVRAALPVPVVNPGPLSYAFMEALLSLGLTHSRDAYPCPENRHPEILSAMLDAAASTSK